MKLTNVSLHIFNFLTFSIDFVGSTETWHEDATSPSLVSASLSSYSFIELARSPTKPFSSSHSAYRSISLFSESIFSASNIHYPSYSTFECLFSSFESSPNFTFVIALIYRPPTSSFPLFFEEFSVLTENLYMHSSLFLGDFPMLNNNKFNFYFLKLDKIFDLFNLTQHVNFPTHTAGNTLAYVIFSFFTKLSISSSDLN